MRRGSTEHLSAIRTASRHLIVPTIPTIAVGMGTCGIGNGAEEIFHALTEAARVSDAAVRIKRTGCFGFCAQEPLVLLFLPGKPVLLFSSVTPRSVKSILNAACSPQAAARTAAKALAKIESWDFRTGKMHFGTGYASVPHWNEVPFFQGQEKVVLRNCGIIDPENIEEYIAVGGYSALQKVLLSMNPEEVIHEVSASGLRGRGGAGFPTGKKWELMRIQEGPIKYVVCNADEGDPGAYMNRNELESDPHMLIEGMAIGAYAMGAREGFIYIRAEYPLAISRLRKAIADAHDLGLLGEHIFGTDFSFELHIVQGAGAFVCGEETALLASAEGKAGRPMPRPPFPAQSGYLGAPTTINNVETWANVPVIMARGGEWFSSIGTGRNTGTKVFSLVGKSKNTGLVELPLGTGLDKIVYGMGGGAGPQKRIRAVQTGGPSGGCIPAEHFGTSVDYESLAELGAIMGSGGMVVMDSDTCMVDVARYFVGFTAGESCGKCAPCREGLSQMLHILNRISRGEAAEEEELDELETLARVVKDSALCGLGQTAANPVLTTLAYFRDEYLDHIREKRCDAGVCDSLYLALCENSCPLHMNIPGYLQLLKEGRIEEAFELTLRENPLPGTLGRICHFHCQMRCRRETLDEAVAQGEIHRYLADTMYKMGREKEIYRKIISEKLPASGKRVAIIGAGPAGLTAAFFLLRLGHEITIYDEHPKAGGILRYGIPAYRLPKDVLDKETNFIRKLGARFVLNTHVGRDVSMEKLTREYDSVMVCLGAREDVSPGIPGENLSGVHHGYAFLESFNCRKTGTPGKHAVIIGGGNVAIDAARTLLRTGTEVTVAYRRSKVDMPANPDEILGAEEEGVRFLTMVSPEEICEAEPGKVGSVRFMRMKAGPVDSSGRPTPIPSEEKISVDCDAVILAIGERVDSCGFFPGGTGTGRGGRILTDHFTFRTVADRVFAAGDAVTGPATAAEAMGQAKKAARAVDAFLMGEDRFLLIEKSFSYENKVPLETGSTRMNHSKQLQPEERRNNFHEISLGYSGEQALAEASRCLRCDVCEGVPEKQQNGKRGG